jgi:N-methylhydantoinase B
MSDVYAGDILYSKVGGSGGWGDPLGRDVEKVREGVRDGLLTVNRARVVYGVVIDPKTVNDPNPENIKVDYKATEKLRKEMKAKKAKQV